MRVGDKWLFFFVFVLVEQMDVLGDHFAHCGLEFLVHVLEFVFEVKMVRGAPEADEAVRAEDPFAYLFAA